MKKWNWRKWRIRRIKIEEIDERLLLINLYATQALSFCLGIVVIWLQRNNDLHLWAFDRLEQAFIWGGLLAAVVIAGDLLLNRFVPEEVTDDGGMNEKIFRNRPLWHVAFICLVVSISEEMLFRGAIQHALGAYWTSIVFATLHFRYLRHWLMTGMVFSVSYGLGWIYAQTGTLLTPIFAHFMIDFVMGSMIRWRREL
ncbi:MAG TPA: type II CAAX endopeptidase family protein [Bacilli bacterium]